MAKKIKTIKEVLSEAPIEVAEGITISKLSPIFFDSAWLKAQPEIMYRMDGKRGRMYYRFYDDEPIFYTSVTTFIKQNLPTAPQLIEWMVRVGEEKRDQIANESSAYGTFYHAQCATLMINGKYDLDKLPKELEKFLLKENIS